MQDELEQERKRQLYWDYTGQMLWDINAALYSLGGREYTKPQYVELAHPELKKPEMTAEQIKNYILEKLKQ